MIEDATRPAAAQPDTPLAALAALCSLGLNTARATGSLVGRPREIAAVRQAVTAAASGMVAVVVEGEPGIGKTRFLLGVQEMVRAAGFVPIGVTTDEEIRGPFLLARSIFASPEAVEAVEGTPAAASWERAADALTQRDEPGLDSLAPDRRVVRALDLAAVAIGALAAQQPVAILVDDLQWADEDSLRLLRYVVRTVSTRPVLLLLAMRPNETAFVNEAVTLIADMERFGLLRRLRLGRFSQLESTELLQQILGGQLDLHGAAIMHSQAEGVPFVLAEQAQAYREAGLIQEINGVWTLARNADRLMPSAVRTLIQRRAARLPEDTKTLLAEAAILGRTFSLRDLVEVRQHMEEEPRPVSALAETLAPAVAVGMLLEQPDDSPADYSFSHEGVREYAAGTLAPPRRRALHGAIVDMLLADGDPPPGSLPMIARHALAAGRGELSARIAIEAAQGALRMNAADEVLRLVELAHPVASNPQDRIALLSLRDDALGMLRRPDERLEGLAELTALAEALGNAALEQQVLLRRASALRLSGEHDAAAETARRVRQAAAEAGDAASELAACLELGQDLLRAELGEAFSQTPTEGDLQGADEAYQRAVELAEQTGDEPSLAAALRELGVIAVSALRIWYVELYAKGDDLPLLRRILGGERLEDVLAEYPAGALFVEGMECFSRALEIYERLGDRHGIMATIIAMAVASWAADIHVNGSPRHIEEIRRLSTRVKSLTRESERRLADAQMLFGSHIYSRAKGFPDVAIQKGEEAHVAARAMGDRSLEFASAGGTALQHAELGALPDAERWLGVATAVAAAAPTPLRAFQLALWRGQVRAAAGDGEGARTHLGHAADLASEQGRPAARCEALAQLAIECSRLGVAQSDPALLDAAEHAAAEALTIVATLPGHPPWGARAEAALAAVALARGDVARAAEWGRRVFAFFRDVAREDLLLDIMLPAAEALLAGGAEPEREAARDALHLLIMTVAQRILDEDVRVRWFRAPLGAHLTRLAGPPAAYRRRSVDDAQQEADLDETDARLLELLVLGQSNAEIAETIGEAEAVVAQRLAGLFARLGAGSRADATRVALTGKLV